VGSKTVNRKLLITINGKQVENSITGINKQIRQLRKNLAAANNPADRKKYNDELKRAYKLRQDINDELGKTNGTLSKIRKQAGPIGAAMLAAFSAQAVLSFANKVVDTIQLFRELKQETKLLTGLQGDMLDGAVSKTKALADTFDKDYKEVLETANATSKHFGITFNEALTDIEKGFLSGADASGDMLNQLKEYSPLMKEANLSLDEMVALIAQTEKEGIFNDKGIDAVKEGMLAIREGTQATRDALKGIGFDTKKVYEDLANGNTTYFEVLQQVSGKLGDLETQSPEVGTAIADIFKGAGEDAGLEFLQSIQDIDLNLDDLIDTTDEYNILKKQELEINIKLDESWVQLSSTGGALNAVVLSLKNAFANLVVDINESYNATKKLNAITGRENEMPWYSFIIPGTQSLSRFNKTNGALKQLIKNIEETKKQALNSAEPIDRLKDAIADLTDESSLINTSTDAGEASKKIYSKYIEELKNQLRLIESTEVNAEKTKNKELSNLRASRKELEDAAAAKKAEAAALKIEREEERKAEKIKQAKLKLAEWLDEFDAERVLQDELKKFDKDQRAEEEEVLRLEAKFAKLEEQAFGEIELLTRLENEKLLAIEVVRQKYRDKELEDTKILQAKKAKEKAKAHNAELKAEKKLQQDILNSAIDAAGKETRVGQALLAVKGVLAAKEMLIQLGVLKGKAAVAVGEATTATAVGAANTAKVGFPQNIPLLIAFAAQAAGIIAAVKGAVGSAKKVAVSSFAEGGPTHTGNYVGGVDGNGGRYAIVHPNEYMIPEFIAQDTTDPVMPAIMQYIDAKRTGESFADGGGVGATAVTSPEENVTLSATNNIDVVLFKILERLDNPLPAIALYDDNEVQVIKAKQTEVEKARKGAIIGQ